MKFLGHTVDIDFNQGSTKRGAVILFFGLMSVIAYFKGMDPSILMGIGMTVAGAMGTCLKDNPPQ